MTAERAAGPRGALTGLRVVELCDERGAFAGKLLADMGAEVIKVEPPAGDATRRYGPFLDDDAGIERSLYFWHYNTSKLGVTLDLDQEAGRGLFRRLVAGAGMLIESERPGRLADRALDYPDLRPLNPALIMVSITPLRPLRAARRGAGDRPHAARRRRAGMELWLRRPLVAPGAGRRRPGLPDRLPLRGHVRAGGAIAPR